MEIEILKEILNEKFGLKVISIKSLVGYETLNFRVKVKDQFYVLKVYPYDQETLEIIKGESIILKNISHLECEYPKTIPTLSGNDFEIWKGKFIIRALNYLEGVFLSEVFQDENLIASFGETLAQYNLATKDLYIPAIQAKRIKWDLNNTQWSREDIHYIHKPKDRAVVDYFLLQFEMATKDKLHDLPHQIIHNDVNDWNILCTDNRVSGIIDFGDAVYSTRVSEIAVALSYILVDKDDPLAICCVFLKEYHKINPSTSDELKLLYYFIAARMCVSLISSAKSRKENPENEYISVSEKGFWKLIHQWLTVNPIKAKNEFLRVCDFDVEEIDATSDLLAVRNKSIPSVLSISYEQPIHMDSAAFQYMYGSDGATYLDAYNNIPHVGHEHPRVVAAAQAQFAKLNTNTRYLYDPLPQYSEKLLAKFPDHLDQVFFVNSGSAASDLAIRLARNYTQRDQLIVMEHGYHGNTQQGIAISHYKYTSEGGQGKINNIIEAPLPNTYVDGFQNDSSTTGSRYARKLIECIDQMDNIAAFIAEPISGCGGQVPLADGYLRELYPYLRSKDILTISDEVQTGFGRLGTHFWGFEMHGVIPDIIVLGKPIGNGHPMAAVVTTRAIADAFDNGMEFFSSFGGNPVSCIIGSTVLDVLEEEQLQNNAREVGDHFFERMKVLQSKYSVIGDVRGSGLFLGIEIVNPDTESYRPDAVLANRIKNELRGINILVSTDGPFDNVIKMKPPLCFTVMDMIKVIDALESILAKQD